MDYAATTLGAIGLAGDAAVYYAFLIEPTGGTAATEQK
jgi:hypothetical protein